VNVNGVGPPLVGVNQHGASEILKFTYSSLSHAILEVRVDTAERERLSSLSNCFAKHIVCKPTVVGVVMTDVDTV
jgi:hypothetical protein